MSILESCIWLQTSKSQSNDSVNRNWANRWTNTRTCWRRTRSIYRNMDKLGVIRLARSIELNGSWKSTGESWKGAGRNLGQMESYLNKDNCMISQNDYRQRMHDIQVAAEPLLNAPEPMRSACDSLLPLGLALVGLAELFSLLGSDNQEHINSLFDGGEMTGPNIDTRLRCIRDLCGATAYALRVKQQHNTASALDKGGVSDQTPGEAAWFGFIARHTNSCDEHTVA